MRQVARLSEGAPRCLLKTSGRLKGGLPILSLRDPWLWELLQDKGARSQICSETTSFSFPS